MDWVEFERRRYALNPGSEEPAPCSNVLEDELRRSNAVNRIFARCVLRIKKRKRLTGESSNRVRSRLMDACIAQQVARGVPAPPLPLIPSPHTPSIVRGLSYSEEPSS